jgi:hypothetical protein
MRRFIPMAGLLTLLAAVSCKGPSNGDSKAAADSTNQAKTDSGL